MGTFDELMQSGIDKVKAGDRQGGASVLAQVVINDPKNETAWLWLAEAVDDPARKRFCLGRVLAINPDHEAAKVALQRLQAEPAPMSEPTASAPAVSPTAVQVQPPAANLMTLSCPSCGAKLEVTADEDRFACPNCGNEHLVQRSGSQVTLKPILESLQRVQQQVAATSAAVLDQRFSAELESLEKENQAAWKMAGRGLYVGGFGGIFLLINFVFVRWSFLVNLGVVLIAIGIGLGLLGWMQLRSISRRKQEINDRRLKSLE